MSEEIKEVVEAPKMEVSKLEIEAQEIINKMLKKKDNLTLNSTERVGYRTGYELDYLLGDNVINPHTGEIIREIRGLRDGTMVGITGGSGTGKSSFMFDMLRRPMAQFPQSVLHVFDTEGGIDLNYLSVLLKIPSTEMSNRVSYHNPEVMSTEYALKTVMQIIEYKLDKNNYKNLLYDTGEKDLSGKPIKKLVPTFIACDSFSNLRPEVFKEIEKLDLTQHMRKNNSNGMFLTNFNDFRIKANIIFLSIVHEGKIINTDSYGGPAKTWQGLKADTHVGGGKTWAYMADTCLRFNKYTSVKGGDLNDHLKQTGLDYAITVDMYKSRTGPANQLTNMILVKTFKEGFGILPSLVMALKNKHKALVHKSAGNYTLRGYDSEPFPLRKFPEIILSDIKCRTAIKSILTEEWDFLLNGKTTIAESDKIMAAFSDIF